MKRFAIGLTVIAALTLAACSGGGRETALSPMLTAGSALVNSVKARGANGNAPLIKVAVTRASLDKTPGAVLEVVPDRTGLQDFLKLVGQRDDPTPGKVEVWQSSDNAQIILREGVLVGTKGLGGDMRSAQAQTTIDGFDGQGGGGERLITLARLDGTAQTVPFSCDVTQLGRESIQIVDQTVATHHLREDCAFGETRFSNEYWVETGTGKMRRSKQWAGPTYGYMTITRLKG